MRIKRFEAESIPRALAQVKRELGLEAVILQVRKKKRFGNFLLRRRDIVEVVAGMGVNILDQKKPRLNHLPSEDTARPPTSDINRQIKIMDMQRELDKLKSSLSRILSERNIKVQPHFSGENRSFYNKLRAKGLEDEVSQRIVYMYNEAKSELESEGLKSSKILIDHFSRKLQGLLPIGATIRLKDQQQKIVTLVGPTGVGKTTTIAKLSAHFALMNEKKVAMISADTYRIAAPEQLKTYADIIGIPIKVVYTPKELQDAIASFKDYELIFIDTAGRSPSNNLHMSELKAYLHAGTPDEVYLVLSATMKYNDLLFAMEKYKGVNIHSLLFTKLDETRSLDSLINMTYNSKKPLSYFGIGQNVPEDIETAHINYIVKHILQDEKRERSGAKTP